MKDIKVLKFKKTPSPLDEVDALGIGEMVAAPFEKAAYIRSELSSNKRFFGKKFKTNKVTKRNKLFVTILREE